MTTLFQALFAVASILKNNHSGLTFTGSTTTLVDLSLDEPDDFFNNGLLFIFDENLAQTTIVPTDWIQDTHTLVFPVQPLDIVTSTRYALFPPPYSREPLVQAIQRALSELGPMLQRNMSLTTVLYQTEYDLPAGVNNIKRVEIATSAIEPYQFEPPYHFWMEWEGKLLFDEDHLPDPDMPMRLWYDAPHPQVWYDYDEISDAVHIERLAWTAAWFAALNRSGFAENSEPHTQEMAQLANQMRIMESRHPIRTIARDIRWSGWF